MAVTAVVIGTAFAVDGYTKGEEARKKAGEAAAEGRRAQAQQKSETEAQNATRQAEERRKQIREARVRRARILQSSENTGAEGSSGELGALGNLSTAFSGALGESVGSKASGERMSGFLQDQADANFKFNQASSDMNGAQSQMNLGMSIFNAGGGFSAFKSTPSGTIPNDPAVIPMQPGGGY